MHVTIRPMMEADIDCVASVHSRAFPRQSDSKSWISCNFKAYPRVQYFLAVRDETIVGYIEWIQKSGFREEAVLELEQIAVDPAMQGRGIGRTLIDESIRKFRDHLAERGARIKHIIVTTRADNSAQRLYAESLGAKVEAVLSNLYSSDEVFMVARDLHFPVEALI